MSITKKITNKIIISITLLMMIGGISIAIISVSANDSYMDAPNHKFGENNNSHRFYKIKENYTAAKPFMDLQTKYEPELTKFAGTGDQAGFVASFKQYQEELKQLKETKHNKIRLDNLKEGKSKNNENINYSNHKNKTEQTQEMKNKLAMNAYEQSVLVLKSGQKLNLAKIKN